MEICKAPTLRLKALNKHTHIMYIEMENVIQKNIWIMQKLRMLNNNSFELFLKLFDSQVQPIALYGAELWGLETAAVHCEKVHLFALKRFLGVEMRTPNDLVYGETNRYPLFVNSAVRCIRYWLKLTRMEASKLPSKAYRMLHVLDERGKRNRASNVRCKLYQ